MKKLVLLLSVIALLIIATGAVSAAKPAPDTFTITGYTTNNPFEDYETLPNGHVGYFGPRWRRDAPVTSSARPYPWAPSLRVDLCEHYTSQACGVSGELNGSFTFEEWVDVNPVNGKAKNEGIVTIIGAAPADAAVVDFKGESTRQRKRSRANSRSTRKGARRI